MANPAARLAAHGLVASGSESPVPCRVGLPHREGKLHIPLRLSK